jgi:hypothetical protein
MIRRIMFQILNKQKMILRIQHEILHCKATNAIIYGFSCLKEDAYLFTCAETLYVDDTL